MASSNKEVRYSITARDKTGAAWRSANGRVKRHRRLLSGLARPIKNAKLALVQFNASLGAIPAAGLAGITAGFGLLGKAVFSTSMKMDAFMNSMIVSTGSISGARKEMTKIRQLTDELGLNFLSTADAYKKFSIAAKEVGMSSSTSDKIFRSVAKSSAAMGLSAENTRLTLKALEQMISKGTVQSEELRGQLGEHLPGAFGMAAQAMNLTTRELSKMLEQGQILAVDLLPKLADVLENKFAAVAVRASKQARAQFERMKNAWVEFLVVLGQTGIYSEIQSAILAITRQLKVLMVAIQAGEITRAFSQIKIELEFFMIALKGIQILWLRFVALVLNKMIAIDESFQVFFKLHQTFLNLKVVFLGVVAGVLAGVAKIDEHLTGFWNAWTGNNRKASQAVLGYAALVAAQFDKATLQAKKHWETTKKGEEQASKGLKGLAESVKGLAVDATGEWHQAWSDFSNPIDEAISSTKELQGEMAKIQEEMSSGGINWMSDTSDAKPNSLSFFDDFSNERFMTEFNEMNKAVTDITKLSAGFIGTFSDGLSNQLAEALATGKANFADFGRSILMMINKMIIKMLIFKIISGLVNSFGGVASASAPGMDQAVPMDSLSSAIPMRAHGGSVSGGRAIVVGEQGREVFVPDSDGQIIPNHNINKTSSRQGSESGDVINITLNLSTGVQQTVRAEVMGMMPIITKQVKGAVAEARQRGGSFSSQMGVA